MPVEYGRVLRRFLALTVVLWLAVTAAASAADVTVDRFDDPPGDGACTVAANDCSLRQAIAFATWGDTIRLGDGSYSVQTGTLLVDKNLTFAGTDRLTSIIDGLSNHNAQNDPVRIMRVRGVTVAFTDVAFTNGLDGKDEGFSGCSPCSTILAFGGGALFNDGGSVIIRRARFYSNLSSPTGGAIGNTGSLSVTDTDFDGNGAAFGSAIFTRSGTVTIDRVSMRNAGSTEGGGLYVRGGTVVMTNTTVADNGSGNAIGGGVVNQAGDLTLRNVTLVGNIRGGLQTDVGASTTVQNTILGAGQADGSNGSCVAPGRQTSAGGGATTGQAITTSLGNNISEDQTCPLTGPNDHAFEDAHVAPATDNGGFAYTAALLHGSAALDGGNDNACATLDGRGQTRQGAHCDIGAFEAVRNGLPTVITTNALDVTSHSVHLQSSFTQAGESGTLTFIYGQSPQALINRTETIATGPISSQSSRAVDLDGLDPGKRYFFAAVLDNATGTMTGPTVQFDTAAAAPSVTGTESGAVTDSGAALSFSIDPAGLETTYVIDYGTGRTAPVTIPGDAPNQQYSRLLTGLAPETTYTVRVIATSSAGTSPADGATVDVTTLRRTTGTAGSEVTIVDNGQDPSDVCPRGVHVEFGDGSSQDYGPTAITCTDAGGDAFDYETRVKHTYAAPGHYEVDFFYDTDAISTSYAQISEPGPVETATPTPTATATPTAVATATPTPVVAQATPTPTPPTPVFHQNVVVVPSGTVLYKPKGSSKFVPLPAGVVPLGAQIDATKGRVTITSVAKAGGLPESATFYDGIFTVTQVGGVTVLVLSGPLPSCGKSARAAAGKKVKSRKLWGDGKGSFRTQGRYSAATIRGTRWLVEDTCTGTLTKVAVGVVSVRDDVKKKSLVLRAGKSYTAKPKPKHH